MRGHQREAYLMYKRLPSRDFAKIVDMKENSALLQSSTSPETSSPSWRLSFPHVVVATITSFLFGYHTGVVNEPLESISVDLGFSGNALAEGLVVSTCLGGAFVGSLLSGWIADGVGRRRAFQLCALPMIIGASTSATTKNLAGMLLGRLFVGIGMGLGPPVAALYVTEVSPAFVRGTYGSFIQIATCLGLIGALFIGIPVKEIAGWWRICFWMSTIPAAILLVGVIFCAESPHWLYKRGRTEEAETAFEKLLGGSHVKYAMAELSKSDRGDDSDIVKMSELLYGHHFRRRYDTFLVYFFGICNYIRLYFWSIHSCCHNACSTVLFFLGLPKVLCYSRIPFAVVFIGSTLFALQQLSGINAVFYFSSTVFKSAGVPSTLANVFIGIANLTGSVIATVLMDKLGRRVLLLWSFFGMIGNFCAQECP